MLCKIDGCEREVTIRRGVGLCVMHYHRWYRNGTFELKRKRKYKIINPAGYIRVFEPKHPIADSSGYVFEHRFILFNHLDGMISNCKLCGAPIDWKTCHVDHINEDISDNRIENLRETCAICNRGRGQEKSIKWQIDNLSKYYFEYEGERKSAAEWEKDPRVSVRAHAMKQRKNRGLSDYDCLFMDKKTHNGRHTAQYYKKRQIKVEEERLSGKCSTETL